MKHSDKLRIGASGWNYKHWKGRFYPEDLPPDKWLEHYMDVFDTVEINNTFYQLPKKDVLKNWRETVPDNFQFSIKASRYITHMKKLNDPEESIKNFFDTIEILKDKIGVILFQLPPRWNFNPDRLSSFLEKLPDGYKYAFEFRDDSWWNENTYDILDHHNAAFCIYDLDGDKSPQPITADCAYIRMHGPGDKYQGKYDEISLSAWASAIKRWLDDGNNYVYCYFNNDDNAYAVENAQQLRSMF